MAAMKSLVVLDVGLSKPIRGQSISSIMSRGRILALPLSDAQGESHTELLLEDTAHVSMPDGIVYSRKQGRLFFTNMGNPAANDGSVNSVLLDGSSPQVVLSKSRVHTPKQLALDDVNGKLYISDREGLRVVRCNLDGSEFETLVQTGDSNKTTDARLQTLWCVGIAVAPSKGLFYWTQKGASKSGTGRIFCAPIEGSGLREPTLLLKDLPEPIDLEFHDLTNTLYWTDRGELPYGNTFNRVVLDNSGTGIDSIKFEATTGLQHEILVQNFNEAIGLCHDDDANKWYVADMGGTIWSFTENGGDKSVVFHDESCSFTGIALVSHGNS